MTSSRTLRYSISEPVCSIPPTDPGRDRVGGRHAEQRDAAGIRPAQAQHHVDGRGLARRRSGRAGPPSRPGAIARSSERTACTSPYDLDSRERTIPATEALPVAMARGSRAADSPCSAAASLFPRDKCQTGGPSCSATPRPIGPAPRRRAGREPAPGPQRSWAPRRIPHRRSRRNRAGRRFGRRGAVRPTRSTSHRSRTPPTARSGGS